MTDNENHEHSNSKDFLAQMGPLDTLLGSVSYSDTDNVEGKTQQLRTSARVFKKMKFDLTNTLPDKNKEKKEEIKPEDIKQELKKPVNPLWSFEERNIFFEALNEFGKDFESIHLIFVSRLKKKGVPDDLIKTKHQVRHFYHKTFHMCANYLKLSEKIPKNAQELYCLINYGELRRKLGSFSKKNWPKLKELIYQGSIAIRTKGKTIRIKTPMCRALRRLNQLDEKYDDLKLPTRVLVELKPKDMASFLRVQSMAQNPRIKMAMSLQKRLGSLINCVNARWKTAEAVAYDKALVPPNVTMKDCVPEQKVIEENTLLITPLLKLTPPVSAHIELPSIDISEYFTGQSISLTSFQTRKCIETKDDVKKEEPDKSLPKTTDEELPKTPENSQKLDNVKKEITLEEKDLIISQIRQGWSIENSNCLTIGEIYLMFGSDSKLNLEYSWENPRSDSSPIKAEELKENSLTYSLKKLLSLAKTNCDNKTVAKCTCGHVCGAKSNVQFKRPLTTKILKKTQCNQEASIEDNETNTIALNPNLNQVPAVHLFNQLDTLQKQQICRNRGKPRCKQLVVERKLLPSQSESKHQIVSMNIIAQDDKPQDLSLSTPVLSPENNNEKSSKGFTGLLSDNPSNSSMSTGIVKILKENQTEWMNSDVADYSLSSLLGHLDGQGKTNQSSVSTVTEDSQLSHDVDAQLRTLLIENSVDYTAQFADLAAKVVDSKK